MLLPIWDMSRQFPDGMAMGDVTEYLNLSRRYVYQLLREGRLQCKKTSAGLIFLAADVRDFMKDRQRRAKSDPRIRLR